MKKIVLFAVGVVAALLYACTVAKTETKERIVSEFTPERVGELHNLLLGRTLEEYIPKAIEIRTMTRGEGAGFEIEVINTHDLIDYLIAQPEIKDYVDESMVNEMKKIFSEFKTDESERTAQEQFLDYLDGKLKKECGVGYDDLMNSDLSTRSGSGYSPEELNMVRQYAESVEKASTEFWNDRYKSITRGPSFGTIMADGVGGALGLFCPGVGSIVGCTIASALADHLEIGTGGSSSKGYGKSTGVEYWRCNPKYIR